MAIDTSNLDQDSDSPLMARISLLEAVQLLNKMSPVYIVSDAGEAVITTATRVAGLAIGQERQFGGAFELAGSTSSIFGSLFRYSNNSSAATLAFIKTRGATPLERTAVALNDYLGTINFQGSDGTSLAATANINARVVGAVSEGIVPTGLYFSTALTNAAGAAVRMGISPSGQVDIGLNGSPMAVNSQLDVANHMSILRAGQQANFALRTAGGTLAAPTQTLAGSTIGGLIGSGFTNTSTWQTHGIIEFIATENSVAGSSGGNVRIRSCSKGSSGLVQRANFRDDGVVSIGPDNDIILNYIGGTGIASALQVNGPTIARSATALNRYNVDSTGPSLFLGKSRGVSVTDAAVVQLYDTLGNIHFNGTDGTRMGEGAKIWGMVSGPVAASSIPTSVYIATTPVGGTFPVTRFAVDHAGAVGINTTTLSGGAGNSLIDSKLIVRAAASKTALMIVSESSENYAGMKFNIGPVTQPSGSVDYYDISTRPGGGGVGSNSDRTMIRFESALSADPSLILQPAGGKVFIGPIPTATAARLVINTNGEALAGAIIAGMTTAQASADIVIGRTGAAEAGSAGRGSSIQLSNNTNNSHVLLQHYSNQFKIFNYQSGAWQERFIFTGGGSLMVGYAEGAFLMPGGNPGDNVGTTIFGTSEAGQPNSAGCIVAVRNSVNPVLFLNNKTSGGQLVQFYNGGNQVGTITSNGTTTTYGNTSDRRLKTNIDDLPSSGLIIDALRPRTFEFKSRIGFKEDGWIAQEVHAVYPAAVIPGDDGEEIERTWVIDDSKMMPLVIKELQELRIRERQKDEIIAQLLADVKALKEAA